MSGVDDQIREEQQRRRGVALGVASHNTNDRSAYDTEIDVSGREESDEMEVERPRTRSSNAYSVAKSALKEVADAAPDEDVS